MRQQRKGDLERHVQEVNTLLRKVNGELSEEGEGGEDEAADEEGEDEEWTGFEEPVEINREEEYIDEDKYTTVTVETVDISKSGFSKPEAGSGEDSEGGREVAVGSKLQASDKRVWTKEKPSKDRPKKKKKKFRYESKADRKVTRLKERSKNREQAKARRI